MAPQRPSRRFTPSRLASKLVPAVLILLALALAATLVIVALSLLGLMPGM